MLFILERKEWASILFLLKMQGTKCLQNTEDYLLTLFNMQIKGKRWQYQQEILLNSTRQKEYNKISRIVLWIKSGNNLEDFSEDWLSKIWEQVALLCSHIIQKVTFWDSPHLLWDSFNLDSHSSGKIKSRHYTLKPNKIKRKTHLLLICNSVLRRRKLNSTFNRLLLIQSNSQSWTTHLIRIQSALNLFQSTNRL